MITLHTNFGDIKLELNEEKAPKTVANFIKYAESGHYENTVFHRVIDGFMVQGGGFAPGMEEKDTTKPVKNEANNGLSNKKYSVAMARTMEPHSASAQFFININDNKFLDFKSETTDGWGYCVFAEVVDGFDVVDKIKDVATGNFGFVHQDVPLEDVLITSVTVA
ncbi:peptidylprolyl isomerase [Psychromonas sp. Urea-02u-13]|uniref:peptidylprolyl isomerase n=1 Tax=Psychromonas sp. Urea-02u-13 TaxID=2058326 RepID=UPI000C34A86C|nr:peptidylprolyl isomerase [Psychromonas sp. Urea-02u-13]PKG37518.1 peptidylprolyl isomerase [Psychromonas sp. Urea-02u-13]